MAKYKLQEMSSLNGVGEKRVYPKMVTYRQLDTKEFIEKMRCINRDIDLKRDMGGVSRLYKQKYTLEERIGRATEWLETHAFFTLQEYASLNNLSRTTASLELKTLTHGEDAPFDYAGSGSHKVWVKRK